MSKYFLQINLVNKNNKRIIVNYQLYNKDKLIKDFDESETKRISKIIKNYKEKYELYIDKTEENYKIYDFYFLKNYIGIPSKKVNHINKYRNEIIFISTVALGIIGTSIVDHKVNPDLYNNSSVEASNDDTNDEKDFIFIDNTTEEITSEEITTEEVKDENIDSPLIYQPNDETDDDGFKIVYLDDDDDEANKNVIQNDTITSNDNLYTRCIECEDLSNDELLQFIKQTYKIPIELSFQKYGIDNNWIAAIIRRENPHSEVRNNSNGAGVGLMQVEGSVWKNKQLEDINGEIVYLDCDKMNNLSINHKNMDKVAKYIETKNINTFDDLYNLEITEEDQKKYDITTDDLNKYKNATYSIEKGCQIWEYNCNEIIKNNNIDFYNFKLSVEECLSVGNLAYNKGITCINNCLRSNYNIEDAINNISLYSGDPDYQKNIDCFIPEGYVITNRTRDNQIIQIKISHEELENIKAY